MCGSCAAAALKQIADIGAGTAPKSTEMLGAITLGSLAATLLWLLKSGRGLHASDQADRDVGPLVRAKHFLQGLWHLLVLSLALRKRSAR